MDAQKADTADRGALAGALIGANTAVSHQHGYVHACRCVLGDDLREGSLRDAQRVIAT